MRAAYETDALERIALGSCGATALGMTYWIDGLRRWRLRVCPVGVVQRRAWGKGEIASSDVREAVVERQFLTRHPDSVMLVRDGPGGDVTIKPIDCGKWEQAAAVFGCDGVEEREQVVERSLHDHQLLESAITRSSTRFPAARRSFASSNAAVWPKSAPRPRSTAHASVVARPAP